MWKKQNEAGLINILLVEDEDADVVITKRAFKKAEIKTNIDVTRDGMEALDFLRHNGEFQDEEKSANPDVILLDINMPKMGGFELLKILKEDKKFKSIPIVMLTSSRADEDIAKSYGLGAHSYIQKPVEFDKFIEVVEAFSFYWIAIKKTPPFKSNDQLTKKILIIDDDKGDELLMSDILAAQGYRDISFASRGEEGLEKVKSEEFDIIILDINLPGMNGFDFCEKIKEIEKITAKVILISGDIESIKTAAVAGQGAVDFVVKSPDYEYLIQAIRGLK